MTTDDIEKYSQEAQKKLLTFLDYQLEAAYQWRNRPGRRF